MASRLNPYINFRGNAREAMEFYQQVFGGELVISTFGDFQNPDASIADQVMHSQLETPAGFTLMASDTHMELHQGDNISVSVSGDDGDALRGYFTKLAEGGTVTMPMAVQMWGDEFGMAVDRFGINWLVNIGKVTG